jgi:hypothetical protein
MSSSELNSGAVIWPSHLRSTGEGGMFVYAVFADDYSLSGRCATREERPFEHCNGVASAYLQAGEVLLDQSEERWLARCRCGQRLTLAWQQQEECPRCSRTVRAKLSDPLYRENEERWFPNLARIERDRRRRLKEEDLYSVPLLASVCLGSSSEAYFDDQRGDYWTASRQDLTGEGRRLVRGLERLYGRPAELLTFLDT